MIKNSHRVERGLRKLICNLFLLRYPKFGAYCPGAYCPGVGSREVVEIERTIVDFGL